MNDPRKPRRRWRRLLIAAVVLAAAGGGAWYAMGGVTTVGASRPERGPAVEAVYATGAVEPTFWAKVSSTVMGRIADIPVKEGDRVKTGDVLMRLDDREAKHKLAEAEAKERFLTQEVARMSMLAQRDFASQQQFQRTVSDHAQAVGGGAGAPAPGRSHADGAARRRGAAPRRQCRRSAAQRRRGRRGSASASRCASRPRWTRRTFRRSRRARRCW